MRTDYSKPVVMPWPTRSAAPSLQGEPEEEQPVDYSHLDIIAEVERIIERRLVRHTRTSGKWHCACPFPDCTSLHDAFTVWDRPVLQERRDGRREVHFWCGRCGRTGSLISLLRQYREATTGEQLSWAQAARALRIDPRTRRAMEEGEQTAPPPMTAGEQRRRQAEQQRKAEQVELATLDALYRRARAWLAAGQITLKDGRTVPLDQVRAYLLARGYTLEQASALGMAYLPTVHEVPELARYVSRSWRGRILFPLTGPRGASGYAGRTLWRWRPGMTAEQHKQVLDAWNEQHPTRQVARYYKTHQPASYGYDDACQASILVVVEGEFDAASVRLALADLPDVAVCAFGQHVPARLVPANVLHVVLALDGDQAGKFATNNLIDDLQARGVTVGVALPPAGKDWNDAHRLSGLEAIRTEIVRACDVSPSSACLPAQHEPAAQASTRRPIEPPGYEQGDRCLLCGKPVEEVEGAFYLCEDKASVFYGDLFCMPCWGRQNKPERSTEIVPAPEMNAQAEQSTQQRTTPLALVPRVRETWPEPATSAEECNEDQGELQGNESNQDESFTEAAARCPRHHRPLRYGDELGGRYCDQVDCWERYRLMRYGAARGYPALAGVIDPRDYLADTSKAPLSTTASGLLIYPARPPLVQQLIPAGADTWHTYAKERSYHDIDQAIRALTSKPRRSLLTPGERENEQ
jgi:hypothetical protein